MSKAFYANSKIDKAYRKHFGHECEVWTYLEPEDLESVMDSGTDSRVVKHHIFRLGGRTEVWSNVICINATFHTWGHAYHIKEMTICCLYAKWFKSTQPKSRTNPFPEHEFLIGEIRQASGRDVAEWVQTAKNDYFDPQSRYHGYCQEILESF